ncbi:MAG: ParA family protein [Desulfovermiculus sp.]
MITNDNLNIVITYEVNNMDSVCVFNNKGGIGKTTFLCNLASSLSVHHSKKVLIVDADPQCNATTYALSDDIILDIIEMPSFIWSFYTTSVAAARLRPPDRPDPSPT